MRRRRGESGFTLLETICVLAVIAMLAAIALPAFPRGTSRTMLEAYALKTAALLKADRIAAIRNGVPVATQLSLISRTIRSGASERNVQLPQDVGFKVSPEMARQCGQQIQFFPSGMSCGGTLYLSRPGTTFVVNITWLTGGVEIVQSSAF